MFDYQDLEKNQAHHSFVCVRHCEHVEISDALMEIAQEQEIEMQRQKGAGNPSTLPLNRRRDLIGSIAQNGVMDVFHHYGMEGGVAFTPYFDPLQHFDEYDFAYRGSTYDVKSSPMRKFKAVTSRSTFLVSDRQRHKKVDCYCFAQVDLDNAIIHYPGVISYEKFWELSTQAEGEWVKSPAHIIQATHLSPLGEIMV